MRSHADHDRVLYARRVRTSDGFHSSISARVLMNRITIAVVTQKGARNPPTESARGACRLAAARFAAHRVNGDAWRSGRAATHRRGRSQSQRRASGRCRWRLQSRQLRERKSCCACALASDSLAKFTAVCRVLSRVSRFGRRAVRRSDTSGIGGRSGVRGLCLKRR
jgi:hypothetical protein